MTPNITTCKMVGLLLSCWLSCHKTIAQTISPQQDSITVAIAPDYDDVSKQHRFWFGDNYRRLWATPVKLRVLRLSTEKGGLEILKRGGGQQTKSLRLQDATGNEWVIRTVQKDPEKALPENLRETVAKDIVQDQISASHPFGALVVPPLAEALGVLHTNPEIVYVPDDPAIPDSLAAYANAVYLFEEREPTQNGIDTDNTETVLEKLEDDNDNRVNQHAVLRARLLDMVVGDWDRHEDQWRWRELEDEIGDYYDPIPRDRDQIFFKNEGVIPKIGSRKWIMPKFQGFDQEIRGIEGFNFNARYFDRMFMYQLSWEEWQQEVRFVQQQLTDELIDDAVRRMPPPIYEHSGPEIARIIKARRNNLMEQALTYYSFLSEAVDVPGSDKHEEFVLDYMPDGRINLKVYKILKDKTRDRLLMERTFEPKVTKELRLYGRGDDDVFNVQGSGKSGIKVRLIGGGAVDEFRVADDFRNKSKLLIYDRSDKENILPAKSMAKILTAEDTIVNDYNPRSFKYNQMMPLATAGYNLDDGIFVGLGFRYTKHGFRKEPYAEQHKLMVGYALATNSFFGRYQGDFPHLIGKMDLGVELDAKAPNNTSNFFGVGNNTEFIDTGSKPIRYYRTRYDFIESRAVLRRRLSNRIQVYGGVIGQFFSMEPGDNEGRFINLYQAQNPEENLFESKYYAGLVAGFNLDTRNDSLQPSKGVTWNTSLRSVGQLNDENEKYGQLQSEFSLYFRLSKRLVAVNRIGGGTTLGDPAFFQLLYLGGTDKLRGYRDYRFAGEQMAFHNLELRFKLLDFTSFLLPGTLGLIGFNDIGRVWSDNDDGGGLHHGYGGGIYVLPADLILLHGVIGISEEGVLPYFSVGFRF